jgi:hypothetical protein
MGSFFKPSTQKSTTESKGTSTQEANLTGKQSKMNKELFAQIMDALSMGPQVSQSDRNVARGQINDTYDATGKSLESTLASRGFSGPTGKVGKGYGDLSIARNKAFSTTEASLRSEAMQRFQQMIANAFQFNTPRSYTTTSSGTQVGTQPGPSPFDRVLGYAGQGLGAAAGLGWAPFCWIARALYGDDDPRVDLLRHWLLNVWARYSPMGALFVWCYQRYGERAAEVVKRNRVVRTFAQLVFDHLLRRAQKESRVEASYAK